jgi:hypothetical protein
MWLPRLTKQFARGSMSRMSARPPKGGVPLHGEGKLLPYLGTATLTEWWFSSGFHLNGMAVSNHRTGGVN